MKFKKFTNFRDLFLCYILSFILSYVMLYFGGYINILSIWLITNALSYFIYYILSIVYYKKVTKLKSTTAKIIKCDYEIDSHCMLIYEIDVDGKKKEIKYGLTGKEKVGKEETVYISNNNKFVIRERDILMFKLKKLHIIPIIMLLLLVGGIVIQTMNLISISLDSIGESFKYIFLFKFINLFLVFFVIICKSIKDKKNTTKIKVIGTVVDVELRRHSEPNEVAGLNTRRTYTMGTPKYEYSFNGKKQIYVSTTSSTGYPSIGETKELYLDEEGLVIEEEGDIKFLIFFNFMLLVFYLIFFFSIFGELV